MQQYDKNEFWQALKSGEFLHLVKEASVGESLNNPKEIFNTVKPLFDDTGIEMVYGIFFNAKNRLLGIEKLFSGTLTTCSVYPREIIKLTLKYKAAALVLAHNHPSGHCAPSSDDIYFTHKIIKALASIDVVLHDHIVIGERYFSMAENDVISTLQKKIDDQKVAELDSIRFIKDRILFAST